MSRLREKPVEALEVRLKPQVVWGFFCLQIVQQFAKVSAN